MFFFFKAFISHYFVFVPYWFDFRYSDGYFCAFLKVLGVFLFQNDVVFLGPMRFLSAIVLSFYNQLYHKNNIFSSPTNHRDQVQRHPKHLKKPEQTSRTSKKSTIENFAK